MRKRTITRDISDAAYLSVTESQKDQDYAAIRHFLMRADCGLTDQECQDLMGRNNQSQGPRRGEMTDAGEVETLPASWIVASGAADKPYMRPTRSGKRAAVYFHCTAPRVLAFHECCSATGHDRCAHLRRRARAKRHAASLDGDQVAAARPGSETLR